MSTPTAYRVGYPPSFQGFGKFTETHPTVNLCWICKGFDELKQYFEKEGYKPNSTVCPHHEPAQELKELQAA